MEVITEKVSGNVLIEADRQYNSLSADNVTVAPHVTARLYGKIKKDLTLKAGSTVYLHGELSGKLINEGSAFYQY